jgi:hypothetical protein
MLEERERAIHVAHALKDTQVLPALRLAEKHPVVIPIRHPFRVEESFRRHKVPTEDMLRGFDNLFRFGSFNPSYMPVDSEKREDYFHALSSKLGLLLKTDWSVVASKVGTHSIPFEELTPSDEVKDFVEKHKTFFGLFYDQG